MGVEKVENDTSENTMDIFRNMMSIDENGDRLDQHDVSFDNAAQELNETAEMLLKQDEEIKDSLNETSVLLMKSDETLNKTLSGELETEIADRQSAEEQIQDDITGVDVRVDDLENTVVKRCMVDSDCGGAVHFCIDGWCSVTECLQKSDCGESNACDTVTNRCYDYRLNTYINGNDLDVFGDLNSAITYCNSHSNCNGVYDKECDGGYWHAKDGSTSSSSSGSCSWVKT